MRITLSICSIILAITLCNGCAPPPRALQPVLASQMLAAHRLAETHVQNAELLRACMILLIDTRRTILQGQTHRELLRRGYLTPILEPDPAPFDADLADSEADSFLVREVRSGLFTRDHAVAWLSNYALAARMTESRSARDALLSRLSHLHEFESVSAALLAVHNERDIQARALFAELDASSGALANYAGFTPALEPDTVAILRHVWTPLIAKRIPNLAQRRAALDLLESIFAPSLSSPLTTTLAPTENH